VTKELYYAGPGKGSRDSAPKTDCFLLRTYGFDQRGGCGFTLFLGERGGIHIDRKRRGGGQWCSRKYKGQVGKADSRYRCRASSGVSPTIENHPEQGKGKKVVGGFYIG